MHIPCWLKLDLVSTGTRNKQKSVVLSISHPDSEIKNNTIQCSLVKPPPSVQSVVWRYNEFGDKLRDIENRRLCDHMKR